MKYCKEGCRSVPIINVWNPMPSITIKKGLVETGQPLDFWCLGPELNRHGGGPPRDFKSLASTNSATQALFSYWVHWVIALSGHWSFTNNRIINIGFGLFCQLCSDFQFNSPSSAEGKIGRQSTLSCAEYSPPEGRQGGVSCIFITRSMYFGRTQVAELLSKTKKSGRQRLELAAWRKHFFLDTFGD